jgi:hypothetical protein
MMNKKLGKSLSGLIKLQTLIRKTILTRTRRKKSKRMISKYSTIMAYYRLKIAKNSKKIVTTKKKKVKKVTNNKRKTTLGSK